LRREDDGCSGGQLLWCDSAGDADDVRNGASNVGDVGGRGGCSWFVVELYDEFVRWIISSSHTSVFSIVSYVVSSCSISGKLPVYGGINVLINVTENCKASAEQ